MAAHGAPVAFLVTDDAVWFATGAALPWTPVLELVQGVRQARQDADLVLRRRIHLVGAPEDELARAVVQVAARRFACVVPEPGDHGGLGDLPRLDAGPWARAARAHAGAASVLCPEPSGTVQDEREGLDLADRLAAALSTAAPHRHRDREVGAVLVDSDGQVLATARNTSGHNRTLHAEVNLVQGWWARHGVPLPAGSKVLVSLQPCRMCAALLVAVAEEGGPVVVYRRPDPGRLAQGTALASRGLERPEGIAG